MPQKLFFIGRFWSGTLVILGRLDITGPPSLLRAREQSKYAFSVSPACPSCALFCLLPNRTAWFCHHYCFSPPRLHLPHFSRSLSTSRASPMLCCFIYAAFETSGLKASSACDQRCISERPRGGCRWRRFGARILQRKEVYLEVQRTECGVAVEWGELQTGSVVRSPCARCPKHLRWCNSISAAPHTRELFPFFFFFLFSLPPFLLRELAFEVLHTEMVKLRLVAR